MEKKYPVLKCNEELWTEIKPVLESFSITEFTTIDNFEEYPFLISNYGFPDRDKLVIGNIDYNKIDASNSLRYLVDTKEEFLSTVAKLLGKEYPPMLFDGVDDYSDIPPTVIVDKQKISDTPKPIAEYDFTKAKGNIVPNKVVEYPCIKCTQELYNKIKDILEQVGYQVCHTTEFNKNETEYLVLNFAGDFGEVEHLIGNTDINNRYLCTSIREFLIKACELKGFKVVYIDNAKNNNSEYNYFGFCANHTTKEIGIYENEEPAPLKSIIVQETHRKKFKKKRVTTATMPAKGNDFDKDKGSDLDIDKNINMEKINIANKLKYCKKGTKLYSPIFGEVELGIIDDKIQVIVCNNKNETCNVYFETDGRYYISYKDAECLLFPSKDNRDWNSFQVLEPGHRVMVSDDAHNWFLRLYVANNKTIRFNSDDDNDEMELKYIVPVEEFDFTTEDITINKEKSIV